MSKKWEVPTNQNKMSSFVKKHRIGLIATGSVIGVAGISMGIAAPFSTQVRKMYVDNSKIDPGNKSQFFFITDGGDIHDGSFNEAAFEAITQYSGNLGNYEAPVDSNFSTLYHSYNLALTKGAHLIEVNGFNHTNPMIEFSNKHPEAGIIFLDGTLGVDGTNSFNERQQGNVESIVFATEQVGYLAGYASAAWADQNHAKNGKPGNSKITTAGGIPIPPVTTYMAGFEQGMWQYNTDKHYDPDGKNTGVQMWLPGGNAKYFGGFEPDPNGQVTAFTSQAIENGVDVIFPVGGPQTFSAIRTLIKQNISPNAIKVVGVDQDLLKQGFAGLPQGGNWNNYVFASATKAIKQSLNDSADAIYGVGGKTIIASDDNQPHSSREVFGHIYNGTLANNWMELTGGIGQTVEDLFKSLNLDLNYVKGLANKATPKTPHFGS